MAFERLQKLGDERFKYLVNGLIRGKQPADLAREMQSDWKEFTDVRTNTLIQQLLRLRTAAAEGMFGPKAAAEIKSNTAAVIPILAGASISALDRMEELIQLQRTRVLNAIEKEKNMPVLVGSTLQATNAIVTDYKDIIEASQDMRFKLGYDPYTPLQSQQVHLKGGSIKTTSPDGTVVERSAIETYSMMNDIFDRRGIPKPSEG